MPKKNLIRFDWAIKRLLRNKANFSVLEGFLSELLKDDLKIKNILESEGNQKTENDKYNRVDILVENSKGELVIIEVQNQNEFDYFHRMVFGTSKVITDYISIGEAYKNIKKVYSINIIYFDLGQGEDYIYHGITEFYGMHQADKLQLSPKQKEIFGKNEPKDIFPEYYVIKVNQFDDVAKDTLDQWIFYLKNNEIKEEFNAKGLKEANEILRFENLEEEERFAYLKHLDNMHYEASMVWTKKIEAEDRIRKEEKIDIAKALKKNNVPVEIIMQSTGLSKDEIDKL